MNKARQIKRVDPGAGIPGGEVAIECAKRPQNDAPPLNVWFENQPAHVVAATPDRAMVLVPDLDAGAAIKVSVVEDGPAQGSAQFVIGKKLANGVHPVTSPAFAKVFPRTIVARRSCGSASKRTTHLPNSPPRSANC